MSEGQTLMALWRQHKADCRPVGDIVTDARESRLPGVEPLESGFGFKVTDERQALSAMLAKQVASAHG